MRHLRGAYLEHVTSAKTLCAVLAPPIAALAVSGCGGGVPGDAVVEVDGTPITKATFDHRMAIEASSSENDMERVAPDPPRYSACVARMQAFEPGQQAWLLKYQCEQRYMGLRQEVLPGLIRDDWILAAASQEGLKATGAEVEKRLDQRYPSPSQLQEVLVSKRLTMADELFDQKVSILWEKLQLKALASVKTPSQQEISAYYAKQPSAFERRSFLVVLTKTEARARRAMREITSGESFARIAERDSIDRSTRGAGGVLANLRKGASDSPSRQAMFRAKAGVLSGPLKLGQGYLVYEVTKIVPAAPQLTSQDETTIRKQLVGERKRTELVAFQEDFKQKWTARTECGSAYVVENCRQYNPAEPSSPPTPPTPPARITPQPEPLAAAPQRTTPRTVMPQPPAVKVLCKPGGECTAVP